MSLFPGTESQNPFAQEALGMSLPPIPDMSNKEVIEMEDMDGPSFEIMNIPQEQAQEVLQSDHVFLFNLAMEMEDAELSSLANQLLEEVKQDDDARKDWIDTVTLGMKYVGFKVEEFKTVPFMYACSAFDSTLGAALINAYSVARASLFPASGPSKSHIVGDDTQERVDRAERCKYFINNYLTNEDEGYYPDSEKLLLYTIFTGCGFRKVYIDPVTNTVVSRMIKPQHFIVNPDSTSLTESSRMTHVLRLSKREVQISEQAGQYIAGSFPPSLDSSPDDNSALDKIIDRIEGLDTNDTSNRVMATYYEIHVMLDPNIVEKGRWQNPELGGISRPYIVTLCAETSKIASIKRGWEEQDQFFKRTKYFIHYYYLPGFGIYGLGLVHLMLSNAVVLTQVLRQLVDNGMLEMFPGGLKSKTTKSESNDIRIGPATFVEIETGGLPIDQCVMPMPYKGPSAVLAQIMKDIQSQQASIGVVTQNDIPDANVNAPVGTTLALLEVASQVQSTVLRSMHCSLGYELKLVGQLFGKILPDQPYPFAVPGKEMAIMRQDFIDVTIVPVSDPNVITSTHRILRTEAQLKLAQSAPELHDMREAFHRMYTAMNVENIDKILKPTPQPISTDPVSENMLIMAGQKVVASFKQPHETHEKIHYKFAKEVQPLDPMKYVEVMLHVQEHKAMDVFEHYTELQQKYPQAMQMQPMQIMMIPEVQNIVAVHDLQQQLEEQMKAEQQQKEMTEPNPNAVMMADIQQKDTEAHLKDEQSKLKAETEAYKAQLKFESDMAKINAEKEMAEEKHEVDLHLTKLKLSQQNSRSKCDVKN